MVIGDIGWGSSTEGMGVPPDSVTVSVARVVLVIVATLSIRKWNDSLWPLVDSMFRRMKGCERGISKEGGMPGPWLFIGSIDKVDIDV
jgi:hypothetical protein